MIKDLLKLPEGIARTENEKAIVEHFNNIVKHFNEERTVLEDLRKSLIHRTFNCEIDALYRIVRQGKVIK